MEGKKTSLVLRRYHEMKVYCAEVGITMGEFVDEAIRKEIERRRLV